MTRLCVKSRGKGNGKCRQEQKRSQEDGFGGGPLVRVQGRGTAVLNETPCRPPNHHQSATDQAAGLAHTQMALTAAGEPAVHFNARFAVSSAYYAAVAVVVGGAMLSLAKTAWGRDLLLKWVAGGWQACCQACCIVDAVGVDAGEGCYGCAAPWCRV